MATLETVQRAPGGQRRPVARKVRVVVRRVSPWSVLKFSLLFYFCLMLVGLLGVAMLYSMLDSAGILDPVEQLLGQLGFGTEVPGPQGPVTVFEFNFFPLMRVLFLIGLLSTVLWAAFTVFVVFLYNLIADLVGGVEVTLLERR